MTIILPIRSSISTLILKDVAFFTRTSTQLLNDPTAGDDFGQRMIATKVPEADPIFGLGIVSLIWYFTRKKTVN
ncbi:hypothetical protein [Lyngbya sp. PCC 8106]|uniref:hypothetical protein n=1 Tax=Lyngbya sp. (strain PCC 8106) TaxID=313612 RepID=UPI0000EAC6C8|nr:hypothetical protein [Lyngbya sp. PCC 8106]EAW34694.1 hypothetical protein L8106_25290 [Lyngbya sp. PCC 8106]